LSLIGTQRIQSDITTNVSSDTILIQIPVSSGCGAFFDYCIIESGGAKRLGTVMSTWDSSGASWTDTSTPDLNNSTQGCSFSVSVSSGNVNFNTSVTSGTWTIRLAIRIIY
jgi:hypothetical protein